MGISDSVCKTIEYLWNYNENNDIDWLLIASLDKQKKKNTELHERMNQLLHLLANGNKGPQWTP